MSQIIRIIESISKAVGKYSSYLVIPLTLGILIDVFLRFLFKKPTIWAFDFTWMLYGIFSVLGAADCLRVDKHVRMDLFYNYIPAKYKPAFNILLYAVLFFPAFSVVVYYCGLAAFKSLLQGECASASTWRPPVYPFKLIVFFSLLVFYLQGIADFLKNIDSIIKRKTT